MNTPSLLSHVCPYLTSSPDSSPFISSLPKYPEIIAEDTGLEDDLAYG